MKSGGEYFIESVTSIPDKRGTGLYSASQAKNDGLREINYLVDEILVLVGIFILKKMQYTHDGNDAGISGNHIEDCVARSPSEQ